MSTKSIPCMRLIFLETVNHAALFQYSKLGNVFVALMHETVSAVYANEGNIVNQH